MAEVYIDRSLNSSDTVQQVFSSNLAQDRAQIYTRHSEQAHNYDYPLQHRVSTEWVSLLGEDFKPATNVDVFRKKREEIISLFDDLDHATEDDLKRKLAYLKISAVSLATSYGLDINDIVIKKLFYVMQDKYPPPAFAELRALGNSVDGARTVLREMYENGVNYQCREGIEYSDEEIRARMPREVPFSDLIQDGVDSWQRSALGKSLSPVGSFAVVVAEADELLEEFNDHTEYEINTITDEEKLRDKIGEEIADVIIGVDGYFAAKDECVLDWQNFALDRMIDTFGDVKKLRGMGVPTEQAMDYLSECRVRFDNDKPMPISPTSDYKGPKFMKLNKRPLVLGSALEMQH